MVLFDVLLLVGVDRLVVGPVAFLAAESLVVGPGGTKGLLTPSFCSFPVPLAFSFVPCPGTDFPCED